MEQHPLFYFGENVDACGLLAPVIQPTAQANARTHLDAIRMTMLDDRWRFDDYTCGRYLCVKMRILHSNAGMSVCAA
jgi:hypothetical protein